MAQIFAKRLRHVIFASLALCANLGTVQAVAKTRNPALHSKTASAQPYATPIVVAAEPDASQAGMKVLLRGGTVIDAAIAIQATLSLVEPQSSGIGGGAFMLYYDAKTKKVTAYNGREKAPSAANSARFLKANGKPMDFAEAITSGRATGVPGAMFMLESAHKAHGKLAWNSLFVDPIRLASEGFIIPTRLGHNLQVRQFPQKQTPDFQAYFSDGKGGLLKAGDHLKNPAYATTLRTIAKNGMQGFRRGPLAQSILTSLNQGPLPSDMTLNDLKAYSPKSSDPICAAYRIYIVCETPPPSGGAALIEALKIIETFPINQWGKDDPKSWAVFIEAQRLMYADRDQYMADPDFVPVPTNGLIDEAYAATRAATIVVGKPSPKPSYGIPKGAPKFIDDKTIEPGGTTHFVVMDRYGNALSMTTTVESLFGSGRMAGGFFLNNQLTDFSSNPVTSDGKKAANAVEGNKRPRSAMSPTMVFDKDHKLIAMIGSPGGPSIIAYNFKVLVGVLDWGMTMQEAINLPNVVARGDSIRVEQARMNPSVYSGLIGMGYGLTSVAGEESGLNGVLRQADGQFEAGADPRRNGKILIHPMAKAH